MYQEVEWLRWLVSQALLGSIGRAWAADVPPRVCHCVTWHWFGGRLCDSAWPP